MRIIAFDQATITTGWAVMENGRYIKSGLIRLINAPDKEQRTKNMVRSIYQLIDESVADLVVIQDVQNQSNNATFKLLSQLQGAILGYCIEYEYETMILSASAWRKELEFNLGRSVKRNSLKLQAVQYVAQNCHRHLADDEAEAVCIGCAAFKIMEAQGGK